MNSLEMEKQTIRAAKNDSDRMAAMEFFEIYDQYYRRVRNFILSSVRDEWAADDLTQETFIRVQGNLNTLKDSSKLASWIFRIAHNLCQDHFRNLKRTSSHEYELNEAKDVFKEAIVQKRLEQREMSSCVQDVVSLLPESFRSVITLFDVAELSHREIADILDTTVENVKVRLHRARKELRVLLEKKCAFEVDERGVLVCEPVDDSKK
ncbi:putative RNA polymerase sigma factor SigZ [Syntrophobacter sp. SbD1]|nr:putative RNA polymerase sigma factor SigZ [Syntrophobacter sp. SbD1]